MINIITPCSRPQNLPKLFGSIDFEKIHIWYIVYDTSNNRMFEKQFEGHPKITELECSKAGICGHPQTNYAIDLITDGYVYILDDDNIIHPEFWNIVSEFDGEHVFTFDQYRPSENRNLSGKEIIANRIDTAQFIVPAKLIGDVRWLEQQRGGDFHFINGIKQNHPTKFKYITGIYSYWNYIANAQLPSSF